MAMCVTLGNCSIVACLPELSAPDEATGPADADSSGFQVVVKTATVRAGTVKAPVAGL